jgi:hypothetical protein
MGQETRALKVVFIMGRGRSGSTLLDNLLGELDGFFSAGEVHNLWNRGLVQGRRCGCGRSVPECELWSAVTARSDRAGSEGATPEQVVAWQQEVVDPRNDRRLKRIRSAPEAGWDALSSYVTVLGRLYEAVAHVTGARVIVDSSKRPTHGLLLDLVPGITAYYVHLVRDPRAVAYSRRRVKFNVDRSMRLHSVWHSSALWRRRNRVARDVTGRAPERSMMLRYEDFVARPAESIRAIAALVDVHPTSVPIDGHRAWVGTNHTASGNPSRFHGGEIVIREDDEWLRRQSLTDRVVATAMTLGPLSTYGYPLWPGAGDKARKVDDTLATPALKE